MFDKKNLRNMDLLFVGAVLLLLATSLFVLSTASYNLVDGQPYTLQFIFIIFLLRGISIAMKERDLYGVLIASGIVTMFTFHILVNAGMNSGIMPVTGIPLPFISYGGSAMWANMISIGLLLNINLRSRRLMFK